MILCDGSTKRILYNYHNDTPTFSWYLNVIKASITVLDMVPSPTANYGSSGIDKHEWLDKGLTEGIISKLNEEIVANTDPNDYNNLNLKFGQLVYEITKMKKTSDTVKNSLEYKSQGFESIRNILEDRYDEDERIRLLFDSVEDYTNAVSRFGNNLYIGEIAKRERIQRQKTEKKYGEDPQNSAIVDDAESKYRKWYMQESPEEIAKMRKLLLSLDKDKETS